jgi:hypothetical protein
MFRIVTIDKQKAKKHIKVCKKVTGSNVFIRSDSFDSLRIHHLRGSG